MSISPADLGPLVAALIIPSLVSLGCYIYIRWLEMKDPHTLESLKFLTMIGLLVLLPVAFLLMANDRRVTGIFIVLGLPVLWLAVFSLLSIPGSILHRKSTGGTLTFGAAFQSVLLSVWFSHWLGLLILWSVRRWPFDGSYASTIFGLGVLFYPVLAPIAVSLWLNLKVRPGIDEAFDD